MRLVFITHDGTLITMLSACRANQEICRCLPGGSLEVVAVALTSSVADTQSLTNYHASQRGESRGMGDREPNPGVAGPADILPWLRIKTCNKLHNR